VLDSFSSWQEFSRDSSVNGDCQMSWIGRVFRDGEAGFATISDSGSLCTSLIRDVVNLLLVEMKDDGFIDRAWESELYKIAGQCDSSQDGDSGQLTIQAMGGTFILYFLLTASGCHIHLGVYEILRLEQIRPGRKPCGHETGSLLPGKGS
jgi:hypothetical protein